ncbi:MAG: TrkA C-terminal domain-containing protein [Chloroherpetonaceae bacterium]
MDFKEADLPGIGKKFTVKTSYNQILRVIIHLTGKRELFIYENEDEDEDSIYDLELTEEDASLIGSILMGTYFKPEQEKQRELILSKLSIEWVDVPKNNKLTNRSIEENQIRKKTGITIIAIIRDKNIILNLEPTEIIKEGDTLVIVGTIDRTEYFKKEFNLNG